jgi:ATP-dependent Clp protease ATP-binding subunit ClpA
VQVVLKDGKLAFEIEGREREPGAPVVENPADAEPATVEP